MGALKMSERIHWPDGNFSQIGDIFLGWLKSINWVSPDNRVLDVRRARWAMTGPDAWPTVKAMEDDLKRFRL
jgi:hypothetical protein